MRRYDCNQADCIGRAQFLDIKYNDYACKGHKELFVEKQGREVEDFHKLNFGVYICRIKVPLDEYRELLKIKLDMQDAN